MTGAPYSVIHPWTRHADVAMETELAREVIGARGCWVETRDGQRLLDGSAGLWNVNVGYGRAEVIDAIGEALGTLSFRSLIARPSAKLNALANRLLGRMPSNMSRVMFHCTGTAAVEAALLLVRQHFKLMGEFERSGIIALEGGFHGSSLLATAVTGLPGDAQWFEPLPPHIYHIAAPLTPEQQAKSLDQLEQLIRDKGARHFQSMILEPVMGVEGAFVLPEAWIEKVAAICQASGIKLISDEVACGLGRVGRWVAWPSRIKIDVVVIGKGLSGGYIPAAASVFDAGIASVLCRAEDMDVKYGSTMDGCPAACAAASAVLDIIEREDLIGRARDVGEYLLSRLGGLLDLPIVERIQGDGLMMGIKLCARSSPGTSMTAECMNEIVEALRQGGLLLDPEGNSALLIYPPLILSHDEADFLAVGLTRVLERF
jgi:adenosylmethionine-8-amino-7-oxononanoate aminotransferase